MGLVQHSLFQQNDKLANSCLRAGDSFEIGSNLSNTVVDIAMLNPQTL